LVLFHRELLENIKHDLVNSNVNQWNEKFPQSPITPADVNMRKALRKVLRKNKMIDREESLLRMEKAND
jgi:hypothetical protein